KGGLVETLIFMWERVNFPVVYASFEPQYKMYFFFGIVAFGLAILGLLIAFKKYKIVAIWTLFLGLFFYYNQYIRWDVGSVLIHYLRLVIFFNVSLVVPAAIGLAFVVVMLMKLKPKLHFKYSNYVLLAFVVALSLFVFVYTFHDYVDVPAHLDVYHYIESQDVDLINQIDGSFVVTYNINSRPIKLLTDIPFGYFNPGEGMETRCEDFMKDVEANKYKYVLSDKEFDCGPWFELYKEHEERYLYKVIADLP
ncbi:hypothetical protein KY316_03135, partial [Candidatus Woesearchaeota archaeon]|nr:hypothetical protein [Candidatus Woesearchaeota archaeon]